MLILLPANKPCDQLVTPFSAFTCCNTSRKERDFFVTTNERGELTVLRGLDRSIESVRLTLLREVPGELLVLSELPVRVNAFIFDRSSKSLSVALSSGDSQKAPSAYL